MGYGLYEHPKFDDATSVKYAEADGDEFIPESFTYTQEIVTVKGTITYQVEVKDVNISDS